MNPSKTVDLDYRRLVRAAKSLQSAAFPIPLRVALLSDAATQQFVPVLKALLAENGVGSEFYEGSYDAIELEVVNEGSGLYAFRPDAVLIINATQALRSRYWENGLEPELDRFRRVWDALAAHSKARIVQCNFVLPYERPFGQFDLRGAPKSPYSAARFLNSELSRLAGERSDVLLCDLEAVASYLGRRNWFDERLWDMSKTFCNLQLLPHAAQAMVELLLAGIGRIVKCVVLDLDNTLWGGVVGDAGPLGIEIAAHGDGEAFYRFQKYLSSLKQRGILLAVCSKNEASNARAPFEQNPNMVLKYDDFAVFVANWDNKADNLRLIRDTLEIGYDSIVFLDDNPFERDLVRTFLPEVIVPELPEDPADYVRTISELNLFETTAFSAEDVARPALYKQEAARREARSAYTDVTDYLKSLEMKITVERFPAAKIPRIAQLFLRSNQFNLTTHRYTEAECTAMMIDEQHCIPLCASLRDRFGDHGLISIIVAWREERELRISDWLMSCRVLGRGVEQFLMNRAVEIAQDLGLTKLTGEYVPTSKNAMVKDFWAQFGFETTDERHWVLSAEAYHPSTVWIGEDVPSWPEKIESCS